MAKAWARQFYSSKAWQDCRNQYGAMRGWLCEECLSRGIYTPGEEVHHIQELTINNINDPSITLNWANLILLCRECHKARHKGHKDRRYVIGDNGEVIIK